MWKIVENSYEHSFKSKKLFNHRKVDNKTITTKIRFESISFLEWIHGDICGPIHPSYGSFK